MADFEDHFVAGSDVALENHTPDTTGTAWTLQRDGHDILAVEDFASNSAAGAISTSDAIGTEDYEVQSDIRLIGAADRTGIGARFTDLSNSLHVRIKSTDDEMEMEKVIGGTRTALAISTADVVDFAVFYTIKLSVEGSGASQDFKAFFGGVERLNPAAPNDAVLDTGLAFIGHNDTNVAGDDNHDWDDYTVTSLVVTLTVAEMLAAMQQPITQMGQVQQAVPI